MTNEAESSSSETGHQQTRSSDTSEFSNSVSNGEVQLPAELPILPIRGLVVYPQTAVPLTLGQPRSIKLVDDVVAGDRLIGLVTAHDPEVEIPEPNDLYAIGTFASIHRLFRAPDGTIRLLVQGLARVEVEGYASIEPYLRARVRPLPEISEATLEVEALTRNVIDQFTRLADLVPSIPSELISTALNVDDPLQLVYAVATYVKISVAKAQQLLELNTVEDKLRQLQALLTKELEVLELARKIETEAQSEVEKAQREYYLREQLKAIQRELGEERAEIERYQHRINLAGLTEEAHQEAIRELRRLAAPNIDSESYVFSKDYLDLLLELPWKTGEQDYPDVEQARMILERHHYGLRQVKERILENLALFRLRLQEKSDISLESSSILCFVGPPGTGKTTLGRSIATALGREFHSISLAGAREQAEIRGHLRTYRGASPGRIIDAIRKTKTINPVIMLDEIDKTDMSLEGGLAYALLEVLDPAQNHAFRDQYLGFGYDLSSVLFITTANSLEPIPDSLLDRMEVIELDGYTAEEKVIIARNHLLPNCSRHLRFLQENDIVLEDDTLLEIINEYTDEPGLRNLERLLKGIYRRVALQINKGRITLPFVLSKHLLSRYIGRPPRTSIEKRVSIPGVAPSLVETDEGGHTTIVEVVTMPGKSGVLITGQMREQIEQYTRIALGYIKANAARLGINLSLLNDHDIQINIPPSINLQDEAEMGAAILTAIVSALTEKPVQSVAAVGEISLSGLIMPVGHVRQKLLAARRSGIRKVILPRANESSLSEYDDENLKEIELAFAESIDELLNEVFPKVGY